MIFHVSMEKAEDGWVVVECRCASGPYPSCGDLAPSAADSSNTLNADIVGRVVPTGNTLEPRFDHTATLLPNGKVLIAAGMARNGVIEPTAELYDPQSQANLSARGEMLSPRGWGVTATLLHSGEVLIAGGGSGSWCDVSCYLASAELYDPSSGTFTAVGNMTMRRAGASAILLQTGDVLIVGGNETSDNEQVASAELYHPANKNLFYLPGACILQRARWCW